MPKPGGLIVSESAAVTDTEALSVTLMLKLLDPAALGVPDIAPPAILKPDGSDPLASVHE